MAEHISRRIPAKCLQYELWFIVDYYDHGIAHWCSQIITTTTATTSPPPLVLRNYCSGFSCKKRGRGKKDECATRWLGGDVMDKGTVLSSAFCVQTGMDIYLNWRLCSKLWACCASQLTPPLGSEQNTVDLRPSIAAYWLCDLIKLHPPQPCLPVFCYDNWTPVWTIYKEKRFKAWCSLLACGKCISSGLWYCRESTWEDEENLLLWQCISPTNPGIHLNALVH